MKPQCRHMLVEGFGLVLSLFDKKGRFLREPFLTCPRAPQRTHRLVSVCRQGVFKMAQRVIVLTKTKGWLQSMQQKP